MPDRDETNYDGLTTRELEEEMRPREGDRWNAEIRELRADLREIAGLVYTSHKEGRSFKVWIDEGSRADKILRKYDPGL